MRRRHLLELHEQPWYPAVWRDLFQLSLGRAVEMLRPFEGFAGRFGEFLARVEPASVLELCSGSGELSVGLWKELFPDLDGETPRLVLSDLYPNLPAYRRYRRRCGDAVDFAPEPVHALEPPVEGHDAWLMIEGLHHFRPDELRRLFARAAASVDGFAAFETTRRTYGNLGMVLLTAPMTLVVSSLLVRPMTPRNLLWGLLLPAVPLTMVVDGLFSNLRSYTVEELDELTRSVSRDDFRWEVGTVPVKRAGGLEAIYLFGWRRRPRRRVRSGG